MSKQILQKLRKAINEPSFAVKVIISFVLNKTASFYSDKLFLKLKYYLVFNKKLNLKNPLTFNEKIQWLKIYDRKSIYTDMVDKVKVKEYVASIIGEEYIIPTLGVWYSPDDIDLASLPNQFVLKCNHDSGGLFICNDKSFIDAKKWQEVKSCLKKGIKRDYFKQTREWPYKNVERKILAEAYMVDESGCGLKDYKFFCFNGKVKALFIASDRFVEGTETKFDFFDENFNHLPFTNGHPNAITPVAKPESFDQMKVLAEKLSQGIPLLRVDFYNINGKIYFGELTFSHWSGMVPFYPEEWDYKFGEWIKLPINNLKNSL